MSRADDRIGRAWLSSGRMLSYVCFGAVSGPTVVVLDGAGSRTQARDAHDIAQQRGIRLLAPDRPGFGQSTADPEGTLLSFADDLAQLLSALGVDLCGLWCQSGGAPFALASAYRLPERVTHLGILAGVGPLDAPDAFDGMSPVVQFSFRAARWAPWVIALQYRLLAAVHRRAPKRAASMLVSTRPAPTLISLPNEPAVLLIAGVAQARFSAVRW